MVHMADFYDELAPLYHLIHQDWGASVRRQGEQLSTLITAEWPNSKSVLDVSCGIGTQAIGCVKHTHYHGSGFDVVISCDNSLPHLLTDDDLLVALKEMLACLSPGGGCIVSVRDYKTEERGANIVKLFGVRTERDKRYLIFQVWDFDGEQYDLAFFFVEEDLSNSQVKTHVMRSRYYAISIERLLELMRQAGFEDVRRLDNAFYQPILMGTRTE